MLIYREGSEGIREWYEVERTDKPKIAVVAQKSGEADFWHIFVSWPGRKAAIRVLPTAYEHKEDAYTAMSSAAQAIDTYIKTNKREA